MNVICNMCGKSFYKRPKEAEKDKRHFCCLECRCIFFSEKKKENTRNIRRRSQCVNNFIVKDNYTVMLVNSKKYGTKEVLIDTEKIEEVSRIFWHVARMYDGYFAVVGWDKQLQKEVSLHRYLMNYPDNIIIDHINRNPLDNRITNLRYATRSENSLNSTVQKNSFTGYKGIRLRENGKYQARITFNKRTMSLGHYNTLEEAIKARKEFCSLHNIIA